MLPNVQCIALLTRRVGQPDRAGTNLWYIAPGAVREDVPPAFPP